MRLILAIEYKSENEYLQEFFRFTKGVAWIPVVGGRFGPAQKTKDNYCHYCGSESGGSEITWPP
jgi:hypothetical protein